MKIRNHLLPRSVVDIISFVFMLIILPIGYWFEVFLVFPSMYSVTSMWYIAHLLISTFLLMNITSNFVYMLLMDTSIRGELMPAMPINPSWKFCDICESVTPPRSWHCVICNICILKRDHHCQFSGCCIGHKNHRYFMYFLSYLCLACIYILYFNTFFILQQIKFSYTSILKFIFPLAVFILGADYSVQHCYTIFYVLNIIGVLSTTILLYYHSTIVMRGLVMYENSHCNSDYDLGSIKKNIVQVFGDRWHLTWISPFIQSKLPNDGINWVKCSSKVK